MLSRSLPALLLFATTSTAAAQAPGEVAAVPTYAPAAPAYYQAPPEVEPMRNRLSIGFSVGGLSLAGDDVSTVDFNVIELAARFRLTPRIELELTSFGGRQSTYDEYYETSETGDLATGSLAIGVRYRFRPDRKAGWWLMGGLGGVIVAPYNADDNELSESTHALGMLGIGGEYRFGRRFAMQAEVRAVSVGSDDDRLDDDQMYPTARTVDGAAGGGSFTLGANFYF